VGQLLAPSAHPLTQGSVESDEILIAALCDFVALAAQGGEGKRGG
jgi:hypothetical protein